MISNLAGVVVLYYPNYTAVGDNVLSYLNFLSHLFIINNTPGGSVNSGISLPDHLYSYVGNSSNAGIAYALNQGARMAIDKGFTWLLTMDQDSSFSGAAAAEYFRLASEMAAADEKLAIIAPTQQKAAADAPAFSYVNTVITSGSLINLKAWKEIGGFNESLFIDEVDHEYAYRVQLAGYKVLQLNHQKLTHQLGTTKTGGYMGMVAKRARTIHSPWRVYYIVRNYLYVRKHYRHSFPEEFRTRDKQFLTAMKNNLFFSGQFFKALKSALKAILDFQKGNFSS